MVSSSFAARIARVLALALLAVTAIGSVSAHADGDYRRGDGDRGYRHGYYYGGPRAVYVAPVYGVPAPVYVMPAPIYVAPPVVYAPAVVVIPFGIRLR